MKQEEFGKKLQNFAEELDDEVYEIYYNQIILNEFDFESDEPVIMFGKHFGTVGELNTLTLNETIKYLKDTEQYEKLTRIQEVLNKKDI